MSRSDIHAAATPRGDLLPRLFGNAPNLLPRFARLAPAFFSRRLHRPIFLIGCGRSGKTVLAELLGRHPDVALFPGEANRLWHPGLYPWRESPHRDRVPPIWVDAPGFAEGSARMRSGRDVQLLRATFGAYQMLRGRPAFLNESALTSMLLSFIRTEFPGARLIHMVRDGRAVAPAWARRQHSQIQEHRGPYGDRGLDLDFEDVLDRCAASWNEQVVHVAGQRRTSAAANADLIEIGYESFCEDPARTLERLAVALELDPAPLLDGPLGHIADMNAQDGAGLPPDVALRIERRMTDGLTLYGYL